MAVQLNHTIVPSIDKAESAAFLAELLGLPEPVPYGPFVAVQASNNVTLDFAEFGEELVPQHYAFLVTEQEFDEIFGRIRNRGMAYWADPHHRQPEQINTLDGGRGVYFEDVNGHNLEILTRPYSNSGNNG